MSEALKLFLLGMAGAAAPEIIRLWNIARAGNQFKFSWFYLIISIFFAGLGGLVAILTGGGTGRSAFYSGVATPVLINEALKGANQRSKRKKALKGGALIPRSRMDAFLEAL